MNYVVYGKTDCPWCDKAVELLDDKGFSYKYIPLDVQKEYLSWFKGAGYKTVPQVFLGDTYIGGFEELKNFLT